MRQETVMLARISLALGAVAAATTSLPAAAQPAVKTPQPVVDEEISITGARRRRFPLGQRLVGLPVVAQRHRRGILRPRFSF
jgi:hypothetical protein